MSEKDKLFKTIRIIIQIGCLFYLAVFIACTLSYFF